MTCNVHVDWCDGFHQSLMNMKQQMKLYRVNAAMRVSASGRAVIVDHGQPTGMFLL